MSKFPIFDREGILDECVDNANGAGRGEKTGVGGVVDTVTVAQTDLLAEIDLAGGDVGDGVGGGGKILIQG